MPKLIYGNNPHQTEANYEAPDECLNVRNGQMSYINLLDVIHGWQITRDLRLATGKIAAASMKHNTAVGVALPGDVDQFSQRLLQHTNFDDSSSAYIRARSSDWSSAYGDIIVITGYVDTECARLIARCVSDGIAAYGFSPKAFSILQRKKSGKYLIIELDERYEPCQMEERKLFGISLSQSSNAVLPKHNDFDQITGGSEYLSNNWEQILITSIVMKYTVSNNIVFTLPGRTISISAGQQSRILATKIAIMKYQHWSSLQYLPSSEKVFTRETSLMNKIAEANVLIESERPKFYLSADILMGSDGFIPFSDNLEAAASAGVQAIVEPSGAKFAEEIATRASDLGITLLRSSYRSFYH